MCCSCRCRHSVPLGLSGLPGVWLVEVVAGSRRLRARISKGGLRIWQRPSVAGQVLQVMDEDWRPVQVRLVPLQPRHAAPLSVFLHQTSWSVLLAPSHRIGFACVVGY